MYAYDPRKTRTWRRQVHDFTEDKTNVLLQGLTFKNLDEDKEVMFSLEPSEASFHH